jgi:hypothetical protein
MSRDFWKSAGLHLTAPAPGGWRAVTPDFIRAYLTRPEVHPIDTSCAEEIALHEALMADPFMSVPPERVKSLADVDVVDAYTHVLAFRDVLAKAGTVEGAYLALMRQKRLALPPVFVDQLVHLICRNMLDGVRDPMRVKAAELLFRDQVVTTEGGRLMLADEEILDMHARAGKEHGLAQLLAETGTPMKQVSLDVLDEDNKEMYWARSDRFDTVVDLRFEQPALDALARVLETWLMHLMRLEVRIEPRPKLEDRDWRWHIGLDQEGTRILNALYEGKTVPLDEMARVVALFRLRFADDRQLIDRVKGRPIYLALAMTAAGKLRMKPQNLLANLPLVSA